LNSHYPWRTHPPIVDDWRSLDDPALQLLQGAERSAHAGYASAITYQLEFLLRFVTDRADDAPLVILFGDHQPPLITPEKMGPQTPVHVISKNRTLIEAFENDGFARALDLTGKTPRAIHHEGFLSLLMRAMHAAYGTTRGLEIPYRERGAALFKDTKP
jgi:hypothetical protein